MSNPQVQQIQMLRVECNVDRHKGEFIQAYCLNPECKEISTLCCTRCIIQYHCRCSDYIHFLDDPELLKELLELQLAVVVLQDKINNQFRELLSRIAKILQPVSIYLDSKNIINLNGVGLLLRQLPKQSILQSIDETKIQIRSLLEAQEQIANDWFNKGMNNLSYYQERHYSTKVSMVEAIRCYEKAIQINPNDCNNWINKGIALFHSGNYEEAIKCYEKVILINPNYINIQSNLLVAYQMLHKQQEKVKR